MRRICDDTNLGFGMTRLSATFSFGQIIGPSIAGKTHFLSLDIFTNKVLKKCSQNILKSSTKESENSSFSENALLLEVVKTRYHVTLSRFQKFHARA